MGTPRSSLYVIVPHVITERLNGIAAERELCAVITGHLSEIATSLEQVHVVVEPTGRNVAKVAFTAQGWLVVNNAVLDARRYLERQQLEVVDNPPPEYVSASPHRLEGRKRLPAPIVPRPTAQGSLPKTNKTEVLQRVGGVSLTPPRLKVLRYLIASDDYWPVAKIARQSGAAPSTAQRFVEELAKVGWAERRVIDSQPKYFVYLLTPEARELFAEIAAQGDQPGGS